MANSTILQDDLDSMVETDEPTLSETGTLRVTSQAFRYCEYSEKGSQTRTLRKNASPIQFVVNTVCDDSLKGMEVEISVEIRDRETDEVIFETFWVTTLTHLKQQSAFIFREFPEELADIKAGETYTYYASALVNDTDDFAERSTRAIVR